MYILKHSMASALALLFLTGTQAHDDTVAGLNLAQGSLASKGATKDRSAQAVQNRDAECFTDADEKNCHLEAAAKYPGLVDISKRWATTGELPKTEAEVFCKGWFAQIQCSVREICKKCSRDKAEKEAASLSAYIKKQFTNGATCKGIKPPGDFEMSCSNGMSSPGNSGGISTGSFVENSANKSLQIIAGVVGVLVVFGLIGVLLFFFVFKKKDDGNKSASGASQPAGKKTQGKTGQSTMDSSKPKSTTGGAKSMTKAKTTKPKTSAGGAKSSKSTTA